jgi:hypothetical protein
VRLRYTDRAHSSAAAPFADHDAVFERRKLEADEFFDAITPSALGADERRVFRQSIAGLLWSKQYYSYDVERWLRGDPLQPRLQASAGAVATEYRHLYTAKFSVPDKGVPLVRRVTLRSLYPCSGDPEFAKQRLTLPFANGTCRRDPYEVAAGT